jgi:hypothetical protein
MVMMNEGENKPPIYHTYMSSIKNTNFLCVVCIIRRNYRLKQQLIEKIIFITVIKSEGTHIPL